MTVGYWYGLAGIASCACNVQKFRFLSPFFLFEDGADLKMESFSCKQSLRTFSPGANRLTFLTFYLKKYKKNPPKFLDLACTRSDSS